MSISIFEAYKKRKRMPKLYDFHTFGDPGYPINPNGPFRDNVRVFLQNCCVAEDYTIEGGMKVWSIMLLHENKNFLIPMYTVEENVKQSLSPFCDHCRCAGWNKNYLSKRKYHFMIPADEDWNKPLEDGVLAEQTHLLHGLVHCNGFGHLISINGIEGGSKFLCGREIMDLWDRICTNLRTRKVTVEDVSKKGSMDLRLLHGVAYGHPWFGRWGYRFCRGSFGVSESNYVRALEVLSTVKLDTIIRDFGNGRESKEIKQIVRYYKDLSETHMITIRDLLRVMLTVKSCAPAVQKKSATLKSPTTRNTQRTKHFAKEKSVKCRKFTNVAANMDSRWPTRRLEFTAEVIVDALKEKKMTRQEVRDAARLHIGDTGLLDYVLKNMNNVVIDKYIVRRVVNPSTRILEYSLHQQHSSNGNIHEILDGDDNFLVDPKEEVKDQFDESSTPHIAGADVYNDMLYLYKTVLSGNMDSSELTELEIRAILDSKLFVKLWPFKDEPDQLLRFICRVISSNNSTRELLEGEIVAVQPYATLGDLKSAIQTALNDTYCILEDYVVTEIQDLEEMEDDEVLFGLLESGTEICVRGIGMDITESMKYEGGAENWVVRCECGARDDDGERMISCDICEVWQHTICVGIQDSAAVPPLFVCRACSDSLVPSSRTRPFDMQSSDLLLEYECPSELLALPMKDEFDMGQFFY